MKLEEAIGRLNRMITVSSIMKLDNLINSDADIEYIKNADAIEIVLQEIERLQKEKAEYEARWNNTAHELRIFKNECVPKCNIREKIKMLKKIYELANVESEADYCLRAKINILEDLLREEK